MKKADYEIVDVGKGNQQKLTLKIQSSKCMFSQYIKENKVN